MFADPAKPTRALPQVIDGVTFRCYHTGIQRYEWRSDDGRCSAGCNPFLNTFYGKADGTTIKKRFRSLTNAMKAAIAALEG
jgi:hypothetical protein